VSLNDIAVLYRSHFHALELQLELTRRQIPFSITSGIRFFEQAHIKDVTAYLKFIANPYDEVAFKRLAQLLPGIAEKGAEKLWQSFRSRLPAPSFDPADAEASIARAPLATLLQACAKSVPKTAATAWAQFTATISQLEAECRVAKLIQLVLEAGYEDFLHETYDNAERRLDDLEQLAGFAQQFPSLEEFLTQLALLTNVEAEDDQADPDAERVRLSTIHQAKGLEFSVVFVIMLGDGLFPSARALESADGEEEERRLFYVAVTRAKDELYLSYPFLRGGFGNADSTMLSPSRFLNEIPRALINEWNLKPSFA
jgi:DNA helicase-2/ATP-dependent DNA helicase PcrA